MQIRIFFILLIIYILFCQLSGFSQFVDFGRNKVQYSDFEWYILKTKHFQIYYYKEAKELAQIGAQFAEESYEDLRQKFRYELPDTVPVIFYSSPLHFKQTNTTPGLVPDAVGGFFEFIKGRVVLPFDGSLKEFQHVIKHELIHVFTTNYVSDILRNHGKIADRMPPLWFVEGLAEYWSTNWDSKGEMVLRDAVINSYIVGLNDWEQVAGTYFMYKLGQNILMYISEKYGEDKILTLLRDFWKVDNFENVFENTIGKDYSEFDKEYLYYLKKKYLPLLNKADLVGSVTKLLFPDGFAHKGRVWFANNTKEIYFLGNKTGYTSIYKLDLKTNKTSLLIKGESSDEFEQFHYFRNGLDISQKGILAFSSQRGETDVLYLYDVHTMKQINNYYFNDIVNIGSLSWNRNSGKIVFSATENTGKVDLYIFEVESKKLTRLTNDFFDDIDPVFSPDGKYIFFASDRMKTGNSYNYNLFLYNTETNLIEVLTVSNFNNFSPSISEDGSKLIFVSDSSGVQNIMEIEFKNSNTYTGPYSIRQLSSFASSVFDPVWCGNNKIICAAYENGNIQLRLIEYYANKLDTLQITENTREQQILKEQLPIQKSNYAEIKTNLKYEKKFSFDIATTAIASDPVFGTFAGGAVSLSDMLGNEMYYFLLFNNSNYETEFWKSFNIAISKVSLEKRLNYAYGIYHLSGRRYDLRESDFAYFERLYGGYLSFSYPLSSFRRIETSLNFSQSEKNVDFLNNRKSLLLSNQISYVKDNSLWWYTGPIDGERFNITTGYTIDIQNSNENFFSLLLDYRRYLRLGKFSSLAFRGQFFINDGTFPRRFFMGGSWSLRGWSWVSLRGTKLWQSNLELRFPLIDLMSFQFPIRFALNFPGIRGAVYFDAGNCWDNWNNYGETKGSIGAGIRLNALGIIVLRYDFGKRIEQGFTKLQDGFYHQFFFGWDF